MENGKEERERHKKRAGDSKRIHLPLRVGGANRDRTDDLNAASVALSQLSYSPILTMPIKSAHFRHRAARCQRPGSDKCELSGILSGHEVLQGAVLFLQPLGLLLGHTTKHFQGMPEAGPGDVQTENGDGIDHRGGNGFA